MSWIEKTFNKEPPKVSKEAIDRAIAEVRAEGYQSPIDVLINHETDAFAQFITGAVMKSVITADVHVNKDELIRALSYDRAQYEQGYRAGMRAAKKWGAWVRSYDGGESFTFTCSACGEKERDNFTGHYRFCPYCGAQMIEEQEEGEE